MTVRRPADTPDSDALRRHYAIETEIAARLRAASRAERPALYTSSYDELFERVPDHPQLTRAESGPRPGDAADQWRFLRRFVSPAATLLEIGAGDCALAARAAAAVREVIAADVSDHILACGAVPPNVRRVVTTGMPFPLADNSIDTAHSNQLMEHLHPDDAAEQLAEIVRVLRPGGRYVCITPNRLTGPHDVSRFFDDEPKGLHLKEYTLTELVALFRDSGFTRRQAYVGTRGLFVPAPLGLMRFVEGRIEKMAPERRRAWRDSALALPLLQIRLVGTV